MLKEFLFTVLTFLLCSNINVAQQDGSKKENPNEVRSNYNEEQLDSVSVVMMSFYNKGVYDEILKNVPKYIKNAQKINSYKLELRFRSMLGNSFVQLDDIDTADYFFNETLKVALKQKDTITAISMYVNLSNTYFTTAFKKAESYLKQGLAYKYKGERSDLLNFILYHNLAELYVDNKYAKLAIFNLDKARSFLGSENLEDHTNTYLGTSKFIAAGIALLEDNPELAAKYANESLKYKEFYDENYRMGNYKILLKAYERTEKFEKLNTIHKSYDSLRDARFEQEKIKQQEIARTEANLDKVEQELKESRLKNELDAQQKSKSRIALLFVIILAFILLFTAITLLIAKNKRDKLVKVLKIKNKQYLTATKESGELAERNTRFLSTISHELRTPLYGIIGLTSSFLNDPKLKDFQDDFKTLKFSADYLLSLVNDVLNINKYTSKNGYELHEVHFDLNALLKNIIQTFTFLNQSHNNTINLHLDDELPSALYADQTKISQVIMNLVSNASKFTQDGVIDISIHKVNSYHDVATLYFEVKDTGKGIHPDDQQKVFEEFTQVIHDDGDEVSGTGLGLPIVNKILSILGSKLEMKSKLNKGTTFYFTIDVKIGDNETIKKVSKSLDIEFLKGKCILIVDDNKINQLVTKKVLDQFAMVYDTANNGKEAIQAVKDKNYDFILMDINMPVMDGITASGEIRTFNKTTPIIALTATNYSDSEKEIYENGIDTILVKPYNTDNLLELLLHDWSKKQVQVQDV